MATAWLQAQMQLSPENQEHYLALMQLHESKMWHQLGEKLLDLSKLAAFQQNNRLLHLHQNFVHTFEKKLGKLVLARFVVAVAQQQPEGAARVTFLETSSKVVADDLQARLLCELSIISEKLRQGNVDECKEPLENVRQYVDSHDVPLDNLIYSVYFKVALGFYKTVHDNSEYYRNSMLYFTYTPLEEIPAKEQVHLASDVGIAALLGDVYNFGELLHHPVLDKLNGTEWEWLVGLLHAFNDGDIPQYKTLSEQKGRASELIKQNASALNEKIRIMALIEMVFRRPSDDRIISFSDISTHCDLPVDKVELLLIRAFSIKVVKGLIDQVNQRVRVSWVQPRILSLKQIGQLRDRLKDWSVRATEAALYIEDQAPEIISSS